MDLDRCLAELLKKWSNSDVAEFASRLLKDTSRGPGLSLTTEDGVPIRKLFIGNLAERTTNKDLESRFAKYGKIETCYLKRNEDKSNFAFVTFADARDALEAREDIRELHGRVLRVSPADSWHQPDNPENRRKLCIIKGSEEEERESMKIVQDDEDDDVASINVLNDDCLVEIFSYLPFMDRVRIERVCKRWLAVSPGSWRNVKKINLSGTMWGFNDKFWHKRAVETPMLRKILLRCHYWQSINEIDFTQIHVLTQSALTIVGKYCNNLKVIDLLNFRLSQSGLKSITANCQNITRFSMRSLTGPCEKDLTVFFSKIKSLKYLKIVEGTHIKGKALASLNCDALEEINFTDVISLKSNYVDEMIGRCKKLHTVTLAYCSCIDDSTFFEIGATQTITTLRITKYLPSVSYDAMQQICGLVNLESLTIHENSKVTDEFLEIIVEHCKRINHLDIRGCQFVTDQGLGSIAALENLHHLVISNINKLTGYPLPSMHNLQTLECRHCQFADETISGLIASAPNLELLDISGGCITNETLESAWSSTRSRTNNTVLKLIVGGTSTNLDAFTKVSPLLQIVNVSLAGPIHPMDRPSWSVD